jgi:hypothetical protein
MQSIADRPTQCKGFYGTLRWKTIQNIAKQAVKIAVNIKFFIELEAYFENAVLYYLKNKISQSGITLN